MAVGQDRSPQPKKSAMPEAKAHSSQSAAMEALVAIVAHNRWKRRNLPSDLPGAPTTPDLADVARLVVAGLEHLELQTAQLLDLVEELAHATDRENADAIRKVVCGAVEKQWQEYASGMRDQAIKLLQSPWGFKDFIESWPRLRSDPVLRTHAIDVLASNPKSVGSSLGNLRYLEGDLADARRILCLCMAQEAQGVLPGELISLLEAWAGHTCWEQVQHLLWRAGAARADIPTKAIDAVQHVQQLRLTVGGKSPELQLAEMAPESRAAWRRLLKRSVGADADLSRRHR